MSYENAPSTRMLATHCAVCARALRDALSVELGIGPDCRRKHGYNAAVAEVDEEARARANQLIHQVAVEQTGAVVLSACAELSLLGFGQVAAIILKRACAVRIELVGGGMEERRLAVHTPYSEAAVAGMRAIPGRRWDGDRKVNTFPVGQKPAVFAMLLAHFRGLHAMGPKGPFTIERPEPVDPEVAEVEEEARLAVQEDATGTRAPLWGWNGAQRAARAGRFSARRAAAVAGGR